MTGRVLPPMPYHGGKQRIAERIVELFPDHRHYVEPFAGGLSVLLAKPAAKIETVNDKDQALVTFWRVLRDRPDDLARVCTLTPHARTERRLAQNPQEGLDELEVARRVWVQLTQGRSPIRTATGWRFYRNPNAASVPMSRYLVGYLDRMPAAAERLIRVQLECRDALTVITDYGAHPDTLLYVDPPYPSVVRDGLRYRHEFATVEDHQRLAEALHRCAAKMLLSGYPSNLYEQLCPGWTCHLLPASTSQGTHGRHRRVEACWTNYPHADLFAAAQSAGGLR